MWILSFVHSLATAMLFDILFNLDIENEYYKNEKS
jgi:hypothetical protein